MGNTWVVNMRHYDYPDEEADRVTREAVRIATYFASSVEGTVAGPRLAPRVFVVAGDRAGCRVPG